MVTTIQVKDETLEMLKQLRKNLKASSYDEVIHKIIKKPSNDIEKLYGSLGGRGMKWIMKDLRDKHDRF
ncbi:hypothetical protein HYV81_06305 [Candidatus Woesearchaeota archaeon]|nr:hypothetical protein [Candidatus Woesearchaeota archaeon]